MATINLADKLKARLAKLVDATDGTPRVSIGFLEGRANSAGELIAPYAAANEFGVPSHNQPPRPFFRRMVAEKKAEWPNIVAIQLKATDYDVEKTMDKMGQGIKRQLQKSIIDLTDPPLSPRTIAIKAGKTKTKNKGKNAQARGAGWMGPEKPLIDTGDMLNSVDYRVDME